MLMGVQSAFTECVVADAVLGALERWSWAFAAVAWLFVLVSKAVDGRFEVLDDMFLAVLVRKAWGVSCRIGLPASCWFVSFLLSVSSW